MIRTRSVLALLLLAACQDEVTLGDLHEVMSLPARPNTDLDILFVIDNSPTMIEEQQALAARTQRLMDALAPVDVERDVHIGVVTTDMGTTVAYATGDDWGPDVGTGEPGSCSRRGENGALRRSTVEGANPDGYVAIGWRPGVGRTGDSNTYAAVQDLLQVGTRGAPSSNRCTRCSVHS